jgi:hypothetical protein
VSINSVVPGTGFFSTFCLTLKIVLDKNTVTV